MTNAQQDDTPAKLEWPTAITFAATTAVALIGVPVYAWFFDFSATAWISALVLWFWCGIAIGSGYHRLWSHRTYEAHFLLRVFFALGGALALQNNALIWSSRHRIHHRHVDDEDKDPHSIRRGFWYAHIGWMLRDHKPARTDMKNVPDLKRDPVVMWQVRNYWTLTWLMNLGLPALIGWVSGDFWGCILLAGFLRLVVNHQVTFMINSLAHMWGKRPYTESNTARDNWFLALFTFGEGYHNFHHMFEGDYRNGVRWWQLDINKWFLNISRLFGLAKNFKRTPKLQIMRAKLNLQFERAKARAAQSSSPKWKEVLDREYQQFSETVRSLQELQTEWMAKTRESIQEHWKNAEFRTRIRELEFRLKMQRVRMRQLVAAIPVT